ncbi:MAG: DinB family protein [Bacteroidota bacterium]|nr:DinB family protein [Bacteroidota bacterium]
MPITKPLPSEYSHYYNTYISKVVQNDLLVALEEGGKQFEAFARNIPKDKLNYRYAAGKWTVGEVIAHLLDSERVFAYRAMRFSRNDKTPLAGYDENVYVPESNASNRTLESLSSEAIYIRKSTIALFESITNEMSLRTGKANDHEISVRALGYIIPGHEIHHMGVIKERYLI